MNEESFYDKITPERLHVSYLLATKTLHPESFNWDAQKQFMDLTEEQKSIDIFICQEIKRAAEDLRQKLIDDFHNMNKFSYSIKDIENIIDKRFGVKP